MEILFDTLVIFTVAVFLIVPFLGLLLCMCFCFSDNYRKRAAPLLTTSIWLFAAQVSFYVFAYFYLIYISNRPGNIILDIHPLPILILFSINWLFPLFCLVIVLILMLSYLKKFEMPKYLRSSVFGLIVVMIACLVVAYLIFRDFTSDSFISSVWWLWWSCLLQKPI